MKMYPKIMSPIIFKCFSKYDAKPSSSVVMIVNILGCKRDSSVFTNMVVVN